MPLGSGYDRESARGMSQRPRKARQYREPKTTEYKQTLKSPGTRTYQEPRYDGELGKFVDPVEVQTDAPGIATSKESTGEWYDPIYDRTYKDVDEFKKSTPNFERPTDEHGNTYKGRQAEARRLAKEKHPGDGKARRSYEQQLLGGHPVTKRSAETVGVSETPIKADLGTNAHGPHSLTPTKKLSEAPEHPSMVGQVGTPEQIVDYEDATGKQVPVGNEEIRVKVKELRDQRRKSVPAGR